MVKLMKIDSRRDLTLLRRISQPINRDNPEITSLLNDMETLLRQHNLRVLAAPQMGVYKRVIRLDLSKNNEKESLSLLNPKIVMTGDKINSEEDDVLLGDFRKTIQRFQVLRVKYLDIKFQEKTLEVENEQAALLQKAMDYLDGKLFVDHLSGDEKEEVFFQITGELELKNIIQHMDQLRTKCSRVEKITPEILQQLEAMLQLMYHQNGIGLAANQVGFSKCMLVVDLQEDGLKNPMFLLNPEIIWKSFLTRSSQEGCLSLPGENVHAQVERPTSIRVKYQNEKGEEKILEADELLATCLQHEMDHLEGKLYVDYLSKEKRDFLIKKVYNFLKKIKQI
jgi:peptide deformylase